jgi:hypothetical protein
MKRRMDTGQRDSGERGSALVTVLAIVTAVLLIGSALFIMGVGEGDLVEYATDSARAFWLAEAGQERARTWLKELAAQNPPVFPDEGSFQDELLAMGQYDVTIEKVTGGNPWYSEYEVVATGQVDGAVRQVRSVLRRETFSQFLYFHDSASFVWHTTGDSLDGPYHANAYVRIDGDPWFGGKVTSTEDQIIMTGGSNPVFVEGYELGAEEIPFPNRNDVSATMRAEAQNGGLYLGALSGSSARYQIELARNGQLGYLSYRSYERSGGSYHWSSWTPVDLSNINGVVWSEEPTYIEGTLDGQLTVGCWQHIYITDDILYDDASPYLGPSSDCDDLLGLVSARDVIVDNTAPNRHDCVIHAHIMALWRRFRVEQYSSGPPRGDLVIWGGIAQERVGPVATFNQFGITHGYYKKYHFDERLRGSAPPAYPQTDRYILIAWEDVMPPE